MGDEFAQHIPERFRAKCEICGQVLDVRADGVHQRTSGWVKNRTGGGGHGVSLPERENKWAHGYCVDRATRGFLKQQSMF
jgi:hypothetical protein